MSPHGPANPDTPGAPPIGGRPARPGRRGMRGGGRNRQTTALDGDRQAAGAPGTPDTVRGGIRPRARATCGFFRMDPAFRIGTASSRWRTRRTLGYEWRIGTMADDEISDIREDAGEIRGLVVSLTDLAELTGYHRDTISSWISKRSLLVIRGGRRGIDCQIDVRAFLDWREAEARAEATKRAPSSRPPPSTAGPASRTQTRSRRRWTASSGL